MSVANTRRVMWDDDLCINRHVRYRDDVTGMYEVGHHCLPAIGRIYEMLGRGCVSQVDIYDSYIDGSRIIWFAFNNGTSYMVNGSIDDDTYIPEHAINEAVFMASIK